MSLKLEADVKVQDLVTPHLLVLRSVEDGSLLQGPVCLGCAALTVHTAGPPPLSCSLWPPVSAGNLFSAAADVVLSLSSLSPNSTFGSKPDRPRTKE